MWKSNLDASEWFLASQKNKKQKPTKPKNHEKLDKTEEFCLADTKVVKSQCRMEYKIEENTFHQLCVKQYEWILPSGSFVVINVLRISLPVQLAFIKCNVMQSRTKMIYFK